MTAPEPGSAPGMAPGSAAPSAAPEHGLATPPWGVLALAADGTVRLLNPVVEALWGLPSATVVGHRPAQVQPGVLPPTVLSTLEQAVRLPWLLTAEEHWLPHTRQWVRLHVAPAADGVVWVYWEPIGPSYPQPATNAELLVQQQMQFRILAESLPDVVTRWDVSLRLRYANSAFAATTGRPGAALLGQTVQEISQVIGLAGAWTAAMQQVLETGLATEHSRPWQAPGGLRHFHVRLTPEHSPDGQVEAVLAVARDVTEVVEAQQSRAASENLLHRTEEVARTGSYEIDLATMSIRFSYGMYHLFGEAPQSFTPSWALIDARSHPDDVPVIKQVLEQAVAERQPYTYQRRIYRSTGQLRTLEAHGIVVCDAAGVPVQLLGLVQDVTERVETQAEVLAIKDQLAQRATNRYHTLFNAIDEGFALIEVLVDAAGQPTDYRFLEVNPAFARQAGTADIVGKTSQEVALSTEPDWVARYGQVALTGEPQRFEAYAAAAAAWYDVYATRSGEEGSRQVALVFTDITQRKQAEQWQAFLLTLSDALRFSSDPVDVHETVTQTTLQYFGADRCYYCEIVEGNAFIRRDAARGQLASVAGEYPLSRYALFNAAMQAGQPFVVHDVRTSNLLDEELRPLCIGLQIISFISVPVIKHGQAVGSLCLVQSTPREWTTLEVKLVAETAERTWAAVERARTEAALLRSQQRLQKALSISTVGVIFFNLDGDIHDANEAFQRMSGYSHADFESGKVRCSELTPPEFMAAAYQSQQQLLTLGQNTPYERECLRPDGSRWWGLFAGKRLSETECVEFVLDISASKEAEHALYRSEEQFRTVANLVPDLLWRSEPDGSTTWYNQRWLDYTGQTPNQAYDYGWTDTIHPDDRTESVRRYQETIRREQTFRQEHRIRSATGDYRWFMVQAVPVRNAQGQIREWFGAATDIHERKQAEEAVLASKAWLEEQVAARTAELQTSRDMLQSVFDTSLVAMSVLHVVRDEHGAVLDFLIVVTNKELEQQTGRTDLVGKLYATEYPSIKKTGVYELMLHVLATGAPGGMEYYSPYDGFDRWYSCQFVKLDDGLVATNLDITERKRAEQDNLRLRLTQQQALFEAVQAAQEVERRRLAESLHNGVGQILVATKLRLDRLHAPPRTLPAEVAAVRQEAGQLLTEAIRQTRTLSHELVPLVLDEFGLEEALRDICRKLSTSQRRFTCHVSWDAEAPALPKSLQLALYRMAQELGQNIVKHAQGATEGSLELETTPGWVLLRVEDNGAGFAQDLAQSAGLGLRSIRDRVALLGGVMETGNDATSGAYVRLRIPFSSVPLA